MPNATPHPLLHRLAAALDALEAAAERKSTQDEPLSDTTTELAVMQQDRVRLALELDAALEAKRDILEATEAAQKRIANATNIIEKWLAHARDL